MGFKVFWDIICGSGLDAYFGAFRTPISVYPNTFRDYPNLAKHPAFNDERMGFDVVLVGTKISQNDTQIARRLKDVAGKGSKGLVSGTDERIRVYVKSWSTIFNDFDVTHRSLLQKLKIQRDELEYKSKTTLVDELQVPLTEEL